MCQITGAGSTSKSASECDASTVGVPGGSFAPTSITVDQATGDLYAVDDERHVDIFSTSGKYLSQITATGAPTGTFRARIASVAIDDHDDRLLATEEGTDELQEVRVHATEGEFRLKLGTHVTSDIKYSATPEELQSILANTSGIGKTTVYGTAGSYGIDLGERSTEAFTCENGTLPLGGGSGCATSVTQEGNQPHVVSFAISGGYLESWSGSATTNPPGTPDGTFHDHGHFNVAANNSSGTVYVSSSQGEGAGANGVNAVEQFSAEGHYQGRLIGIPGGEAFSLLTGLAVQQGPGEIWVGNGLAAPQLVEEFSAALTVPTVTTESPGDIQGSSLILHGHVDPDETDGGTEVTVCTFEYGSTASYGQHAACEPSPPYKAGVDVSAQISGLKPGTFYHYRVKASNANEHPEFGKDEAVETLPAPKLSSITATEIEGTTAALQAEINPRGYGTEYYFEYGTTPYRLGQATSSTTRVPEPAGALAAGTSPQPVSVPISGLIPGTTYHFRLIAKNSNGVEESVDHSFVYIVRSRPLGIEGCANEQLQIESNSTNLPDCRAYEKVTPADKNSSVLGQATILNQRPDVSADGTRLTESTIQCFAEAQSCSGSRDVAFIGSSVLFSRGADGWATTSLDLPGTDFPESTSLLSSADASGALFSAPTPPQGEDDFYRYGSDGSTLDLGPVTPPAFGARGPFNISTYAVYATANLSNVIFLYTPAPGETVIHRWPFDSTVGKGAEMEYSGPASQPALVGVKGGRGSTELLSTCSTEAPHLNAFNPMSADGSTVFFIAERQGPGCTGPPVNEVFARLGEEHTVAVSEPDALSGIAENGNCVSAACLANMRESANFRDGEFEGAAEDGSRALFTSPQQLTDQASQDPSPSDSASGGGCTRAGGSGCNLYLYEMSPSTPGNNWVDVSAGDTSGGGPRVQGVMGMSSDASHLYFVAKGVLAANQGAAIDPSSEQPEVAVSGADNLYLYERDAANPAGKTTFIARLPESDDELWDAGISSSPANVTPDGDFLVFPSHASLTSDDTRPEGPQQIYRYSATAGELLRVSIGQQGFNDDGNEGEGNAVIVLGHIFNYLTPARPNPTMSDSGGRVFFTSPVALTPEALNDVEISTVKRSDGEPRFAENLYEWEIDGEGSCKLPEGCVYLLSDGHDTAETDGGSGVRLDAVDSTGQNVFFRTTSALVPEDTDTQSDMYDARVDGGFPTPAPIEPCQGITTSGDGCRGGPSEPSLFGSLPTLAAAGSGNLLSSPVSSPVVVMRPLTHKQLLAKSLKACKQDRKKAKRQACEKAAKKRYGARPQKEKHGKSKDKTKGKSSSEARDGVGG
jgi:hypothetical protein